MSKIKTNIKMRVNPEQSKKVQEICFANNIGWWTDIKIDQLDKPFLFIDEYISFMYEDQEEFYVAEKNEEVSAELFIRTNGTCVESENTTEENNKGEIMEEVKLECLVKGYEGTYFEIGQIWETKGGERLRVKGFDFKADIYKLTMSEIEDSDVERYYTSNGRYSLSLETDFDLVKLISTEATTEPIPSEESQPKTLSVYLKENNAYESFVENSTEDFLNNIGSYHIRKSHNDRIEIGNSFNWADTKQDFEYWFDLYNNQPENLVYDMNEIIFAEVDKRIAEQKTQSEFITTEEFDQMFEQKTSKRYMVFVEGKSTPRYIHDSYDSAETEAKRLSAKLVGSKVSVVEIVSEFKSKVIVEEI